ncbi:MAG: FG-GAP-like repeat-containing protein, partial [Cyanobacteriota bacterium]
SADASAQWIDQDNDGDLDLFLTLQTEQGPLTKVLTNPVVGDPAISTFQELGTLLPGLLNPSAAWADVDGDSDLDLVLSGAEGRSGTPYLQLFRNTTVDRDRNGNRTGSQNSAPSMNLGVFEAVLTDPGRVRLSWRDLFSTGEEPYTTNVRLGASPGGNDIIPSLSRADGRRLVSQPGNNGMASARELALSALRAGQRYYWSVQTIDNGFLGSAFSAEQAFVVNPFATTGTAPMVPGDAGLDLRALRDGQAPPPVPATTVRFSAPATGFAGAQGLLADWSSLGFDHEINEFIPGSDRWLAKEITGAIDFTQDSFARTNVQNIFTGFARFEGYLLPPGAAPYSDLQLITNSDDGIRIWVDSNQDGVFEVVINNFGDHAPTVDQSSSIAVSGNRPIPLRMDWFNSGGPAILQLSYQSVSQGIPTPELIPVQNLGHGPVAQLNGPTVANEGELIVLNFAGVGLNSYPLELRVSGEGIDGSDFRSIALPVLSANGVTFTYELAADWQTEGLERATFQLYGQLPNAASASSAPETWTAIGNAVTLNVADTSPTPAIVPTIVDVDGDGQLELIRQVNYPDRAVLAFPDGSRLPLPGTSWQHLFVDLNLDDRPDLLTWSATTSKLFRGNASSSSPFTELTDLSSEAGTQSLPQFRQALAIDANTDGRPDLWLAGESGVRLFQTDKLGLRQRDFATSIAGVQPLIRDGDIKQLLSADFDGDGDNDLSVGNGATLRLFKNTRGSYSEAAVRAGAAAGAPLSLSAAHDQLLEGDADNDGRTDLLVLSQTTGLRLFLGTTTGFRETDLNGPDPGLALTAPSPLSFNTATWFDADHDGRLDIAAGLSDGSVRLFHQQDGVGLFCPYINQPTQSLAGLTRLDARDMDADGDLDLVAINATGQHRQIENIGATANAAPTWEASATNPFSTVVSGQSVTFVWRAALDDHTPAAGLSYTLRVGTAPGLADIFSTPAAAAGQPLLAPFHGNVGPGADRGGGLRGWTLNNLEAGTYHWSVQAIDGSGRASSFSPEQEVRVLPSLSVASVLAADLGGESSLPADQLRLVLPFPIKAGVNPDRTEFKVSDGVTSPSPLSVASIAVSADRKALTLTLNRAVSADQPISVSTVPGTDAADDLQDAAGGRLPAFTVETLSRQLELLPVSAGGISLLEGDAGTRTVTVRLSTSFVSSEPITVDYEVYSDRARGDTAETGSDAPDLLATSGTLTIPANGTSGSFQFQVVGDTLPEGTERFRIRLSNPSGAQMNAAASELLVNLLQESGDGAPLPTLDLK